MPSAVSAATGTVTAGSGSVGPPPEATQLWQFVIYDRANNALADITSIATSKKMSKRLSRPSVCSFQVPADSALVYTNHSDGYPILSVGRRALKVRYRPSAAHDWTLMFNGIIWYLEDQGGEDRADCRVDAYDPLLWAKFRYVRDDTGDFSTPEFFGNGSDPTKISGPDLVQQTLANSFWNSGTKGTGGYGDGYQDEEFGLDWGTGTFDVQVPPAYDLSATLSDFPILLSDFWRMLSDTGTCDIVVDPVDDTDGYGTNIMGILNAYTRAGNPSSPVHYDYGAGDYSIQSIRRRYDIDNLCNKLWYYLGPPQNVVDPATDEILIRRWLGNITKDDPNLPDPPQTTIDAEIYASRSAYGVAMDVRIYDDNEATYGYVVNPKTGDIEYREIAANRPMYHYLWQFEHALRHEPREMLFVTPIRNAPFDPLAIGLGDEITINSTSALRQGFSATQRVYGWDVEIGDENSWQITNLVCSADDT